MTPKRLRELAEQCRELSAKAVVPEVKTQLALWAVEFDTDGRAVRARVRSTAPARGARKRLKAPE
jgi:hypothetical protein